MFQGHGNVGKELKPLPTHNGTGVLQYAPSLNSQPFAYDPKEIDAVLLTHAHLDHCGRLPLLANPHRTGVLQYAPANHTTSPFKAPIFMTPATRDLCELTLYDSAKISQEDKGRDALYTEREVTAVLKQSQLVEYHQPFAVGSWTITYRDAGHIMGSASLELVHKTGKRFVFSGDLGNSPEPLLKPTELFDQADVVVMESTYGDRTHSSEDPAHVLAQEIQAIEKSQGTLLIPAFSVERTQELLHIIDHLKKMNQIELRTPVFLDSPMAIRSTQIYREFIEHYSPELAQHTAIDDPFDFPYLIQCETVRESKFVTHVPGPKVIIAGSGMMTGGRILHHAKHFLPKNNTRLLIVGFQAEGTLGRMILDGAKRVFINHREVHVHASIRKSSGLSAHADQPKLLTWLKHIQGVKMVCLVHGEPLPRQVLSTLIHDRLNIQQVHLPHYGETVMVNNPI